MYFFLKWGGWREGEATKRGRVWEGVFPSHTTCFAFLGFIIRDLVHNLREFVGILSTQNPFIRYTFTEFVSSSCGDGRRGSEATKQGEGVTAVKPSLFSALFSLSY